MFTRPLFKITAIFTLSMASAVAQGGFMNLVQNGEFEETGVTPAKWAPVEVIPHWQSSTGQIEIWAESFQWGNDLGSDGLATGQHAEITWNRDNEYLWTEFVIPETFSYGSTAMFSFDVQNRKSSGILATVLRRDEGGATELARIEDSSAGLWLGASAGVGGLSAGDEIQLMFRSLGGGSSGAHIDQVAFNVAVPIPGTMALLGLGLAGLGFSRRKK